MQNDVLKNKIVPWQKKGRWVHGIYDYADSAFITSETDQILIDSGSVSSFGSSVVFSVTGYDVLDLKVKTDGVTINSAATVSFMSRRYYTTGKFATIIGPTSATGTLEIWAFIE